MESSFLSQVVLPIALFVVMLGVGLSLELQDFRRVTQSPRSVLVGLGAQMILLPLLGFGIALGFGLSGVLAVGLLILCLCPGGATSNMFCYLANGNVALSITLTAIVSLVAPFSLPIFANLGMDFFLGQQQPIHLPLGKTILTLIAISILPIAIGMLLRNRKRIIAEKMESPVKIASIVFLALIVLGIMKQNWNNLPDFFAQAGLVCLILNLASMACGFLLARLFKLDLKDRITVGVELGIQNGTTALFVSSTLLENSMMAIPAASYSILMFISGGFYSWFWSKRVK